jgi:DNA-binding XRE family transcriptional regulator
MRKRFVTLQTYPTVLALKMAAVFDKSVNEIFMLEETD